MGMINTIFNDDAIRKLKGNLGIGHTRYSTSASSEEVNCQPFVVHTAHGAMAVAHNGELINCESLRRNVLERGVGLSTHSDSELITQALCLNPPEGEVSISSFSVFFWKCDHLQFNWVVSPPNESILHLSKNLLFILFNFFSFMWIQVDGPDWPARIKHLMTLAPLSYSLVIMMKDRIYGVRDVYGNRPLCIGKIVPVDSGNRKLKLNLSSRKLYRNKIR